MPNTIKELSVLNIPKSDGTLQEYEIVDSALRQTVNDNKPNWNAKEIKDSESGEITGYENGYISNKPAIKSGTGLKSIIENRGAEASAECAHAEGYSTIASAKDAHAEGGMTVAKGANSHAEGGGESLEVIISGEANSLTYTFENDITSHYLLSGELFLIDSSAESQIKIPITSIDIENKTIVLSETISQNAITSQTYYIAMVTTASGSTSHAEGNVSVASGSFSHAEGRFTLASEQASHAEGYHTVASGQIAHAEGYFAVASGGASHAEGQNVASSGSGSHAEGIRTTASGNASHAEGHTTIASGQYSHAEGYKTTASNNVAHVEGYSVLASGYASHAEGMGTSATYKDAHAEGFNTSSDYIGAHAEGFLATATTLGAHAEGCSLRYDIQLTGEANTLNYTYSGELLFDIVSFKGTKKIVGTPNGPWDWNYSQNIDTYKTATITAIDTENKTITVDTTLSETAVSNRYYWIILPNVASGAGSHAEGTGTIASGQGSHVEGRLNTASGINSHASGELTVASTKAQTVIGTRNIPDDTTINLHPSQYSGFGKYAFIVGNGADNTSESNAHTLDWQGNGWYAGKLTVGSNPTENMDVATKQYVDNHVPDLSGYVATSNLATLVNPLIQAALAEYGDITPAEGQNIPV